VLPKVGAGLAIAAVAAAAGVISFGHIYELTLALHQSVLTARLMPVAIDGLITVGSVVLLQSGSRLGWLGVGPGLALSVFANVESGIRYGWLSAVWAGIPALSFFLATFILERWLKSQSSPAPAVVPSASDVAGTVAAAAPTAPKSTPETVAESVPFAPVPVPPAVPRAVPAGVPRAVPAGVPVDGVPPIRARRSRTVTPKRTQAGRSKVPEKVFAAELAVGELPSVRAIKGRMKVGTDRARVIRGQLAQDLRRPQSLPEESRDAA
jgi:hypothetical protein